MYSIAGVRPGGGRRGSGIKKKPGRASPIKWMSSPENHIIYKDRLGTLRGTTE
jgi:hypothetical protein